LKIDPTHDPGIKAKPGIGMGLLTGIMLGPVSGIKLGLVSGIKLGLVSGIMMGMDMVGLAHITQIYGQASDTKAM